MVNFAPTSSEARLLYSKALSKIFPSVLLARFVFIPFMVHYLNRSTGVFAEVVQHALLGCDIKLAYRYADAIIA